MEGAAELFNKDFTERYRTGQDVSVIIDKFIKQMQDEIDKYKAEQIIYNHSALTTAISNILAGLIV